MLPSAVGMITQQPIVQVGWTIFEPVETAAEKWSKLLGIGPFFMYPHAVVDNIKYRGKPGAFDHTPVVAQWGGVQLELMLQHCKNPSHLRDICPDEQPRFANISWFAADFDEEIRRLESLGYPLIWSCSFAGIRVGWCDTRPLLGCCAEIFEESADLRRSMEQCRIASQGWDGTRLVRPMEEMMAVSV